MNNRKLKAVSIVSNLVKHVYSNYDCQTCMNKLINFGERLAPRGKAMCFRGSNQFQLKIAFLQLFRR